MLRRDPSRSRESFHETFGPRAWPSKAEQTPSINAVSFPFLLSVRGQGDRPTLREQQIRFHLRFRGIITERRRKISAEFRGGVGERGSARKSASCAEATASQRKTRTVPVRVAAGSFFIKSMESQIASLRILVSKEC